MAQLIIGPAQDTYIYQYQCAGNQGASSYLHTRTYSAIQNKLTVAFFGFDLSSIPPASQITSAVLTLWQSYGSFRGDLLQLARLTIPGPFERLELTGTEWKTGSAWNTANYLCPCGIDDITTENMSPAGVVGAGADDSWNVADLVTFAINNQPYAQWMLKPVFPDAVNRYCVYFSSRYGSQKPSLTVNYEETSRPAALFRNPATVYGGG